MTEHPIIEMLKERMIVASGNARKYKLEKYDTDLFMENRLRAEQLYDQWALVEEILNSLIEEARKLEAASSK